MGTRQLSSILSVGTAAHTGGDGTDDDDGGGGVVVGNQGGVFKRGKQLTRKLPKR
jgi:hypothetical protein